MRLETVLKQIDEQTARAFVQAARHVIDAMLIEGQRVAQASGPKARDYNSTHIEATTPAGGWISDSEVHELARRLSEAIAAEKWVDGIVFAVRLMGGVVSQH